MCCDVQEVSGDGRRVSDSAQWETAEDVAHAGRRWHVRFLREVGAAMEGVIRDDDGCLGNWTKNEEEEKERGESMCGCGREKGAGVDSDERSCVDAVEEGR